MKYICKIGFSVPCIDDDGRQTQEEIVVEVGDVYEKVDVPYRVIGGPDTVRLLKADGTWLELTRERFDFYFEPKEAEDEHEIEHDQTPFRTA